MQSFAQTPVEPENPEVVKIKISKSFPVKFGLRKNLQQDQISFEVVKSIIHVRVFDRVMLQIINPREFDEIALLRKVSLLAKKFTLIVPIFDFVDFEGEFQDED